MTNEELVERIKAGENPSGNMLQLWQQVKDFIHSMAKAYKGYADVEEMEQEGFLALYDAVAGYNPAAGRTFLTYAGYWIRNRMNRYLEHSSAVRIPSNIRARLHKYEKFSKEFEQQTGREPTEQEARFYLCWSPEQLGDLQTVRQIGSVGSLDVHLTADEPGSQGATLGDMIASGEDLEDDAVERMQQEQLQDVLWGLVDALEADQAAVIKMRFLEGVTMQQAGARIGCSTGQAHTLENKGIRELQKPHNMKRLSAFLPDDARADAYHGSGVERFNRTWTSSTERVALHMVQQDRERGR